MKGAERTIKRRSKKKGKHVYISVYLAPGTFHATWYCMFERKHSAARHNTTRQGRTSTLLRCRTLASWAKLSYGGTFLRFNNQYSTYKPVPGMINQKCTCLIRKNPTAKHSVRHSTSQHRIVSHRTTGQGTTRHPTALDC